MRRPFPYLRTILKPQLFTTKSCSTPPFFAKGSIGKVGSVWYTSFHVFLFLDTSGEARDMGKFELISGYKPDGDQPQAIQKLAESVRAGNRYQTLLGATGTGKSVAWDEPVTVDTGAGLYRGTIGALLDPVLSRLPERETQAMVPPAAWRVLAWDTETGSTKWRNITALSRHASPPVLHALHTKCGRSVTVTSDHSVWVLREGQLQLVEGDQVCTGDALPIPRRLPEPDAPLTHLNLLKLLQKAKSTAGAYIPALFMRKDLAQLLQGHYPIPRGKSHRLRTAHETVHLHVAEEFLTKKLFSLDEVQLCAGRYRFPALQPLTDAFATVLGQYIAEGHSADRFSLISVREEETSAIVALSLKKSGIPFYQRKDGDYVIGAKIWHDLFASLIGTHAGTKRLPTFWVEVSNEFLAGILRGYFEGDGGIDRGSVTAVTLSPELASDLQEA